MCVRIGGAGVRACWATDGSIVPRVTAAGPTTDCAKQAKISSPELRCQRQLVAPENAGHLFLHFTQIGVWSAVESPTLGMRGQRCQFGPRSCLQYGPHLSPPAGLRKKLELCLRLPRRKSALVARSAGTSSLTFLQTQPPSLLNLGFDGCGRTEHGSVRRSVRLAGGTRVSRREGV